MARGAMARGMTRPRSLFGIFVSVFVVCFPKVPVYLRDQVYQVEINHLMNIAEQDGGHALVRELTRLLAKIMGKNCLLFCEWGAHRSAITAATLLVVGGVAPEIAIHHMESVRGVCRLSSESFKSRKFEGGQGSNRSGGRSSVRPPSSNRLRALAPRLESMASSTDLPFVLQCYLPRVVPLADLKAELADTLRHEIRACLLSWKEKATTDANRWRTEATASKDAFNTAQDELTDAQDRLRTSASTERELQELVEKYKERFSAKQRIPHQIRITRTYICIIYMYICIHTNIYVCAFIRI